MALIVFTGGARSGKSAAAEDLALQHARYGEAVTVAVFGNPEGDIEFAECIRQKQQNRPEAFKTFEAYNVPDWLSEIPADDILLIDCLGTALSALMHQCDMVESSSDSIFGPDEQSITRRFDALLDRLVARAGDTIVVSNEVGGGIVPGYDSARLFRDLSGRGNRRLVAAADSAYFVVCGRLVDLKALPQRATWPTD